MERGAIEGEASGDSAVVVSPDAGGVERARAVAKRLRTGASSLKGPMMCEEAGS